MTVHSPFGSIPIRCKAKVCSPPLSPALQAHKAHSMQVAPAQQRGMASVKQRIEQDMRLLPNGVARIHARCADGAHNPKRKEPIGAYRTKSVSGPIIHSFRNGYLVLWWSSSHTRPSPHFSGREASSALMPYRSLSRSTSASVGISRSVSAIAFGHSTCR